MDVYCTTVYTYIIIYIYSGKFSRVQIFAELLSRGPQKKFSRFKVKKLHPHNF